MSEMRCVGCGEPLAGSAKFCPACGRPVRPEAGRRKQSLRDHVIIIGALAIAATIYFVLQAASVEKSSTVPPEHPPMTGNMGGGEVDVAAFVQNLPKDFESLVSMGNALMDQGRYTLAVESYGKALQLKPDNADVLVDMGACLHALGKDADAIGSFMKGLAINPGHKIAKFNLGIVYLTRGDTVQARDWWQRFLGDNPPPELKEQAESLLHRIGEKPYGGSRSGS